MLLPESFTEPDLARLSTSAVDDFYEQLLSTDILFVIFIVVYTFIRNVSKLAVTAVYNCVLILYHNKCYFLILGLLVIILTLL